MNTDTSTPKDLNPFYPKALLKAIANLQPKLHSFISGIHKKIQEWKNISSDQSSISAGETTLGTTNPMMIVSDVMLLLFFILFVLADFITAAHGLSGAFKTNLIFDLFPWTMKAYPIAVLICIFGTGIIGIYVYSQTRGTNTWMHFGNSEERRQTRILALVVTLMSIITGLLVGYGRLCANNPELCVVLLNTFGKIVGEVFIIVTALLAAGTIFSHALSGFVSVLILLAWVGYFLFILLRHVLDYTFRLLIAITDIFFHFAFSPLFLLGILFSNFWVWVRKAGD